MQRGTAVKLGAPGSRGRGPRRPGSLPWLWAGVLALGCLNPRPEEDPSYVDSMPDPGEPTGTAGGSAGAPDNEGASGGGGGGGNLPNPGGGGGGGNPPNPGAGQDVPDAGADASPGNTPDARQDAGPDAGVPDAATSDPG